MADSSQARRSNLAIVLVALILIGGAVAAWALGDRTTGSSVSPDTTEQNGDSAPTDTSRLRPADTSLSWFNHSNSVEQFDYEMSRLSCKEMKTYITTDLCGVVSSANGDFMIVGTEGYWDPQEAGSDGRVMIPLDLTVYVLSTDNGPSRAMSFLDGSIHVDYDGTRTELTVSIVNTPEGQVLVLHKRPQSQADAAYDFWDELQIIAASPTGAPTLVAAYEGSNIHFVGHQTGVMFSADRYASPTGSAREPEWSSIYTLMPDGMYPYAWTESVSSGRGLSATGHETPDLVDIYEFPNSGTDRANT